MATSKASESNQYHLFWFNKHCSTMGPMYQQQFGPLPKLEDLAHNLAMPEIVAFHNKEQITCLNSHKNTFWVLHLTFVTMY
jgi:hypothetical protein